MSIDAIPVCTLLRMRVGEGSERKFVDAWQRSAQEIGELPGCIRQDLFVDADDPRTYLIVAEWTDRSALDAFGRSEQRDRLTAALRDLRESAARSTYRVVSTVRGDVVPSRAPRSVSTVGGDAVPPRAPGGSLDATAQVGS